MDSTREQLLLQGDFQKGDSILEEEDSELSKPSNSAAKREISMQRRRIFWLFTFLASSLLAFHQYFSEVHDNFANVLLENETFIGERHWQDLAMCNKTEFDLFQNPG